MPTKLHSVEIKNIFCFNGTFSWTPTSNLTLFVGSNQSGKSSLLEAIALVVRPPEKLTTEHFQKEGKSFLLNRYSLSANHSTQLTGSIQLSLDTDVLTLPRDGNAVQYVESREGLPTTKVVLALTARAMGTSSWDKPAQTATVNGNRVQAGVPFARLVRLIPSMVSEVFRSQISPEGERGWGHRVFHSVYDVSTTDAATQQYNRLGAMEFSRYDEKSPAKSLAAVPTTFPPFLSLRTHRSGSNSAQLALYDTTHEVILYDVHPSGGSLRLAALSNALEDPMCGVVLIDEIESGLHPHQQLELLKRLRAAAKDKVILATTHSETILKAAHLSELNVVSYAGEQHPPRVTITPAIDKSARTQMRKDFSGYDPMRHQFALPLLLVEGVTDKWYLEFLFRDRPGGEFLANLDVVDAHGSELVHFSRWLAKNGVRHVTLHDNDESGRRDAEKLKDLEGVTPVVLPWSGTIEDFFGSAQLVQALADICGGTLTDSPWQDWAKGSSFAELRGRYEKEFGEAPDKVALAMQVVGLSTPKGVRADLLVSLQKSLADAFGRLNQGATNNG